MIMENAVEVKDIPMKSRTLAIVYINGEAKMCVDYADIPKVLLAVEESEQATITDVFYNAICTTFGRFLDRVVPTPENLEWRETYLELQANFYEGTLSDKDMRFEYMQWGG